jgi:CDP-diacylglycerol--glycerol-3-phosphate 3-phosphatidyltransferase
MKINLPDYLSLSRIFFTLLFLIFKDYNNLLLIILFLVVLSDVLDGYLARKLKISSKFGAIIDPLTDKFFVLIVFSFFLYNKQINFLQFVLLTLRDLYSLVEVILTLIANNKKTHKARFYGKITTTLQYFMILILILNLELKEYLIILIFIFGVLAIIDYVRIRWFND